MADYTLTAKLTADAGPFIKGFDKAQGALANIQRTTANAGKKFSEIGKSLSSAGDKLTNRITKPALLATTALAGITLVKGFNRLTGIDDARAKLMGLGHDAKSIEEIMTSALDAVRGTAFGMDEAATTAASAVAAGIEPGKELTRYLGLTGDAAAIAGASLGDMGSIVNKVQTSNKAYNDSLGQLSDRGLPIYQWLAKEAKVTEEAVFEMASKGKISSKMFLDAIENNIGGAAKTIGENSFTAAVSNIGASIGRIGANFLDAGGAGGGFFSTIKPLLTDFNNSLDIVEEKAAILGEKFGAAFSAFISKAGELKASFDGLSPSMQGIILKAVAIGAAVLVGIGPALKILGSLSMGFGALLSVVGFLLSPIGLIIGGITLLGVAFGVAMLKSESFRNTVFSAFEAVKNVVKGVVSAIGPILQSMFTGANDGVASFSEGIGGKLLGAFELISSVVMTVVDVIGQFVTSIMDGFKGAGGEVGNLSALFLGFNPVLKILMMALTSFGPEIAAGFAEIASLVVPILTLLGETLGGLAATVIPIVLGLFDMLVPVIMNLGIAIMGIVTTVLPILVDLFTQIIPIVDMLIASLLNIVQMVAPALITIIQAVINIFQAIIPVVMLVLTTVVSVMSAIIAVILPIIAFILMVVTAIITIIVGVIAPIITFIAMVIASIFAIIAPIVAFVGGVFGAVFTTISGVFRNIMSFITGAISSISQVIGKLTGTVAGVFNTIWSTVSKVMSRVSSTIQGVFTAITSSWTGLKTFVSSVFTGIGDNMKALVDRVKGFVNGVIGGINSAIGLINKIPGVSISPIPQLARGTDDWGGGFAKMNEGGRGELVKLPNGSQVIPHDVSMKYAREAGQSNGGQTYDSGTSGNDSLLIGAIKTLERNMSNLRVVMDGETVGEIVRPHVNQGNAVEQTNSFF